MKVLLLFVGLANVQALNDLQRARAKVPRDEFRAPTHANSVGKLLNRHLLKSHRHTKPCNQFSSVELQTLQTQLHSHHQASHDSIYNEMSDTRALRFSSLEQHEAHWTSMNQHASSHPRIAEMQRDGHCLETIMWWIHHLSEKSRNELSEITLPRLPVTAWREPTFEEGDAAALVYKLSYNPSSTCLSCHGGGLPWQDPEIEPPPIPRQVNGKDRIRRCDEWYGEDEGVCNACEGMAGHYYGDLPDYTIPIECEIVGGPDEIPEDERTARSFPGKGKFAVEMRGSDRWPRASPGPKAECNYTTDCSSYNASLEGQPVPPTVKAHWYSGIRGLLYMDHLPNNTQHGGGLLRHETVYQFPSGLEGAKANLAGQVGETNMHLTEIHVQTQEMADAADPGVMLNLVHLNWTDAPRGRTTRDAVENFEWRRLPSPPLTPTPEFGGDAVCVCVPDPAGLPWFEGAFDNATYKGRVKFAVPWQAGDGEYGPPTNETIVADHYAKWSFHLFVSVKTNLPVLFSSPYGGIASYGNWTDPDKLWPDDINGGWRQLPGRDNCFDPTHEAETCKPYTPPAFQTV